MHRVVPRLVGIALACAAAPLHAQLAVPQTVMQPDALQWQWTERFGDAHLRIADADGRIVDVTLERNLRWSPQRHALADGIYRYELALSPPGSPHRRDRGDAMPEIANEGGLRHAGTFRIEAGRLVLPTFEDSGKSASRQAKDQVNADDTIVQGSACVGLDCVNNEAMSDRTLVLKENNTRVHFADTSISAPMRQWELTANDSPSGGLSMFSILDRATSRRPFKLDAGAPADSIRVGDDGELGLHTPEPEQSLHLVSGDAPTIRLEQGLFGGWGESTMDLRADASGFSIADGRAGTVPFTVAAGAPTGALSISATGVGFGIPDAAHAAHLLRSDGRAGVLVEEASPDVETRVLAELVNNGATAIALHAADRGFALEAGSVVSIHATDIGSNALTLTRNGDLVIPGLLTQGSSRTLKHAIDAVSTGDALRAVLDLPLYTWQYRNASDASRHLGPMAEDVHRMVGLGIGERSLAASDVAGLALAAAQSLRDTLAARDAELDALLERLAELEQRAGEVSP